MELRAGKTVGISAQGTCRSLTIYRCEFADQGMYVCDAHDAQSSASVKVQGEDCVGHVGHGRCGHLLLSSVSPSQGLGHSAFTFTTLGMLGHWVGDAEGGSVRPGVAGPPLPPQAATSRS